MGPAGGHTARSMIVLPLRSECLTQFFNFFLESYDTRISHSSCSTYSLSHTLGHWLYSAVLFFHCSVGGPGLIKCLGFLPYRGSSFSGWIQYNEVFSPWLSSVPIILSGSQSQMLFTNFSQLWVTCWELDSVARVQSALGKTGWCHSHRSTVSVRLSWCFWAQVFNQLIFSLVMGREPKINRCMSCNRSFLNVWW